MTLLKNNENVVLSLPMILLLVGLLGILATARWYTTDAYRGDRLVNYTCTLSERPMLKGSVRQDKRYAFHVKEFFAEFWLIGTAIDEYKNGISDSYKVEPGDTVVLSIQESSVPLLNNPLNHIYVWSFIHNDIALVDASIIQKRNKKSAYLWFLTSGATVLFGLITAISRKLKFEK